MSKIPRSRRSSISALVALSCLALFSRPALAAVPESEILADSSLQLSERATFGPYRTLTITLTTRDGVSTLIADKDGVESAVSIPAAGCVAIWRNVLAEGIESIGDGPRLGLPPDQSHFTVDLRTPSHAHRFTAYGIDALADTRYRQIIREVLHAADVHVYGRTWKK